MSQLLKQVFDPAFFHEQGEEMLDILTRHLKEVPERPRVFTPVDPDEEYSFWRAHWDHPDASFGTLVNLLIERSIHLHHPHYIGHQVSPAAPTAALGGFLSDFLNNGMGIYEMGAPASVIESIIIEWVSEKVGYGSQRGGFLTSGGSLANLTGLLVARTAKRRPDRKPAGILVSAESHYSVDRSVRILDMIPIPVPVTATIRMDPTRLEESYLAAEREGIQVIGLVGNACTTATGTYDDLPALADFCEKNDLWFHIDGAHGAAVIFTEKYRHLVNGLERADSLCMDFHKMLMIPALCTALVFKRPLDSYRTYIQEAQYLFENSGEEWFNVAKRSVECTKYMMSVKIFLLRQQFGDQVFEEFVRTLYDLGHQLAAMVKEEPHLQLGQEAQSNIICFRFVEPGMDDLELDRLNQDIRKALIQQGNFYIVQTKIRSRQFLRCTVMNPFTSTDDLTVLLHEVVRIGRQLTTSSISISKS
ncbi:MAG: pyridoxal-dependent decarboxylase [Saprospiraceae bacterium]